MHKPEGTGHETAEHADIGRVIKYAHFIFEEQVAFAHAFDPAFCGKNLDKKKQKNK
jgi:hypothetical protein